jgi:hypothetical protein
MGCAEAALISGIVITSAACITCFVMTIVFCYDITLTYPNPIINVANTTNLATGDSAISFYMRCDLVLGGQGLENLLLDCGITTYSSLPKCNILSMQGYGSQAFAYGAVASCPTGYLQSITVTTNINVNYVALAAAMSGLGIILVWVPLGIIYLCVTCK